MRYALIGCGRIGPNHIFAAIENKLEIVALCDIDLSRAHKLINDYHLDNVKVYDNYLEMLAKEKLEIVAIASPSYLHAQMGLDCIERGINIIIEKPIALSIEDADLLILKAQEKGVYACANYQNRFNKSVQYIKKALDEGRFGKLLHGVTTTSWHRDEKYYLADSWRGKWDGDGGSLITQSIHGIDLLIWMFGEVSEVFSFVDNINHPYIETDDLGLAVLKFKNGAYGVIQGTSNVYKRDLEETLYVFGTKGTAKAGGRSDNIIEVWDIDDGIDNPKEVKETFKEVPPNAYGVGHIPLYKDMINAIKQKKEPAISLTEGKKSLEVILAMLESAKNRCIVKLPLASGATKNYKGLLK